MAAQDAAHAKPKTFEGAVLLYSLFCILRTSGSETAGRRRQRTDALLIEQNGQQQQPLQEPADNMPNALQQS